MDLDNAVTLWVNVGITAVLFLAVIVSRFKPKLRTYLANNGSIIGGVGLFLMVGGIYLAGNGEKDTDYGYVVCRYLKTISFEAGVALAVNTFLFLLLVIYNRFRSFPPVLVFLALSFVGFTIAQAQTMEPQCFLPHRISVIFAFGSLIALFILLYTKTSIWWYSALIFVFVLSHMYRNDYIYKESDDRETNLRYSETRDAIFAFFSAFAYVAVIFAILVNSRRKPITFSQSIEDNTRAMIILLSIVNSLAIGSYILG